MLFYWYFYSIFVRHFCEQVNCDKFFPCLCFYILEVVDIMPSCIILEAICCRIRAKTLERLHELTDDALSRIMRQVTAEDPIAPLISEPHFKAMDRRLAIVLHTVDDFVRESSIEAVLVSDGFS